MSSKGLLLVFSEVGSALSESEFHGWYNNEHIPLRTVLPGFTSAARFVQADSHKPTWAALYDLTTADYLQTDDYLNLAKTRSEREANVFKQLQYLERRIYTLNETAPVTVSDAFAGHKEGMTLVAVSIQVPPEHESDFHKWYDEEHVPLLRKVPGWLRTRRFILVESDATGVLEGTEGYKAPPKFIALHEYANADGLAGPEWKAATSTPWRDKIFANVLSIERRVLKVFKTF
ncbi:hypothetical protein EW145_g3587 [Phellinidium pouzarii]|uniref:EthD domain-containing protein n=1 Tax=Phellinidium pouzarii TaxID=167371 RepID=A0A4V3XCT5_9AGAM|nr:hypothetical protein EW145_g3587 [Phellinidium pouzarii]